MITSRLFLGSSRLLDVFSLLNDAKNKNRCNQRVVKDRYLQRSQLHCVAASLSGEGFVELLVPLVLPSVLFIYILSNWKITSCSFVFSIF
uniref:Uncharacterized protein n=1 Tax=Rhizophora mucronata TaxID=61149 RepID=A0A2P2Q6A4_RHIMU